MERQYTPEKKKQIPKKEMFGAVSTPKQENKEEKAEEKKIAETPKQEIKEEKAGKKQEKEKPKKTEAIVFGKDLGISTKHSIAICRFIRGKKAEEAISLLEEVSRMKKAIPMKGEIPHRKGKMMSGRYPIRAVQQFIKLLKQLSANAAVNGLELEKARIECKADLASRPFKRGGSERFKRTHVMLKLKELSLSSLEKTSEKTRKKPRKENEKK